jgi:hypothetical protein
MAKKYSDIVSIRESRAAYNIKDEKTGDWKDFIANEQFNGILKKVISSVRNNDADSHKSFWISGTYGTGKSHAGAVIKHLLCDAVEDVADYVNDEFSDSKYDILQNDIFDLRTNKRLFPVMLYGQSSIAHKDDLSLKLQLDITAALNAAGYSFDVKTDFDNYVNHIEKQPDFWEMLIENHQQLKAVAPTRQKLISELKNGDTKTLGLVRNALREGKYHIRLDNNNLTQWFFEVQRRLAEETDYNGLLVIWDEFTEVMTSDIGLSLLVSLQEIDEMIMNSENNSYFLYISHPSALNSLKEEEREKTKGRYHFMGYNMEPVSAFKIMSRKFKVADGHLSDYQSLTENFYNAHRYLLDIYSKTSTNPTETSEDIQKLFPLHPSTANLATYYAREAGSSSRSVFQFIGENPEVRQFFDDEIHFSSSNTITANYLWDYVLSEFNANVAKFGAVTERYNSRKLQVENESAAHFSVFKSVLLLNALNNIANNETVTPSEENIKNLFVGTSIEPQIDSILNWFDDKGIIQRQPGGLFSIQFSALPNKEIEEIKDRLTKIDFRFTSQVVRFGDTVKNEMNKFLSNVAREYQFILYSEEINEFTLLNQIENGYKKAKSYEIFLALLFARNAAELNSLKVFAEKASADDRFSNVAFIVFEGVFENKNYERFIEYQANAQCAQSHGFADQQQTHTKCASDILKEWMSVIRRSTFTYYLRGQKDVNSTTKITTTINATVSPVIFSHGPESLELIRTKFSNTYWKKASVKATVNAVVSFNTKTDICNSCGGPAAHVPFLLQDSVDENLEWKPDIDKNHPLYLVNEFIDRKFKHTDKNQSFNLGEKLSELTSPPFGLYQSYAGMGMVAFAMRKYVKQIFDLNGKPREAQHIVDDVVEMFKVWEEDKTSNKLNFRFETKESRSLCETFIKIFKLNTLQGYNNISSLTDARWAITHEFSKHRGYPLWVLKYLSPKEGLKTLIDNILKICGEADMRNPQLINDTLEGLSASGFKFEMVNLLTQPDSFEQGYVQFLKSIEIVNIQDIELDDAKDYIKKHLEGDIGLWTETEVENALKNWKIEQKKEEEKERQRREEAEEQRRREEAELNRRGETPEDVSSLVFANKKQSAINKVKKISDVGSAIRLLEKICEKSNETILDIINNYDA